MTIREITSVSDVAEAIEHNKALKARHEAKFRETFHLSLTPFFSVINGLDLIELNRRVVRSDAKSMKETITERWGQEAACMIENIILEEICLKPVFQGGANENLAES